MSNKYSSYTTSKGTELPLMSLKGKPYMQVAHRLVWFTEVVPSYSTETEYLAITDEQTVAKVTVSIYDESGKVLKKVSSTKRETKKDFPDHTEKAETGALGRALALLGYGTQFAIADLDEGNRLADSPVAVVEKVVTTGYIAPVNPATSAPAATLTVSSNAENVKVVDVKPVQTEQKPKKGFSALKAASKPSEDLY